MNVVILHLYNITYEIYLKFYTIIIYLTYLVFNVIHPL